MTKQERQGWIIVSSLFVTLLLVFGGGYNTFGIFFTPLLKQFKWSHAEVSTMQAALSLAAGLSAPIVGWLLDRIEARVVMIAGAICSGLALIAASQAHSYEWLLGCYLLLGIGIGGATLLPCALVVANWFEARRGIAMGVAFAGTSLGGMVMTIVAGYVIAHSGWRVGYLAMGIPMIVIVIPAVFFLVRTRPQSEQGESIHTSAAEQAKSLPGLEVNAALRTRSFWLIGAAQFCFAFAAAGALVHLVPYLIGIGYAATMAALVMSLVFGLTSLGKLVMGTFADRVSGRTALAVNFVIGAVGFLLVLDARSTPALIAFVLLFGLTLGAPLVLVPMLITESLGLRRFGTLAGLTGIAQTLGAAIGPVVAGRLYDLTRNYAHAFLLFVAMLIVGAVASYGCRSLASEHAEAANSPISA